MFSRASQRMVKIGRWLRHRDLAGGDASYRLAHLLDRAAPLPAREMAKLRPKAAGVPHHLSYVAIGGTGTCNASCIHCPTGKVETAHVPRGEMPMALTKKIIDGIADNGIAVTDQISFGLFGDGLVDSQVVERVRYAKTRLPDVNMSVNTNGAAYAARHAPLRELIDVVGLHCESLTEATYNELMQPLRLTRVMPKLEAVLRDFPGKVHVSVPVSRMNLGELEAIRGWFMDRGAMVVVFDPLSNRCAEDETLFERLSLAPGPIRCGPDVLDEHLIVDCDGLVLACCQDFRRVEPVGDLRVDGFLETLAAARRAAMRAKMAGGRHCDLQTCGGCRADVRTPNFPFDVAA